jgi:sarcosine oxidase, subunit gamma
MTRKERASMPDTPALDLPAWLKQLPPATRFILQGDVDAREAASRVWEVPFPVQACRAELRGERATLWLGPQEFLLWQAGREFADLSALEQALQPHPHSLVDVSHRQVAFQVTGPLAAEILNGACPLDLHEREFPVGMCTRTVLAKAEMVLWRTATQTFHIEIWRSFAPYVGALLQEIGKDYAAP